MPWGLSVSALTSAIMGGDSRAITGVLRRMSPRTVGFGRRQLLKMVAPSMLRQGLSGNRILSAFRGAGVGFRRQNFLRSVQQHGREPVRVQDYLGAVKPGESYDLGMARDAGVNYADEYTAVARVDWRDPLTGELHEQHITMGMTEGMTDEDVEGRLERDMTFWYREDGEEWAGTIESWELEDLAYNSNWAEPWGGLIS